MGNEIKALRTQNSLREWAELVADCRGSGMTVKAWCAEHRVTYSQYYRWQRKVYEAMQEPEFVEIAAPASEEPSPAVSVKLQNASIEVYSGCDASLAAAVLRALSDAYVLAYKRLEASTNPSPSQYSAFTLSLRRPQNRKSVFVNGSSSNFCCTSKPAKLCQPQKHSFP